MRSWMIGLAAGVFAVSVLPDLLPPWAVLSLFIVSAWAFWRDFPGACLCGGLVLGIGLGHLYGYSLLERRLDPRCESIPLAIEGVIVSLPRISPTRDGGTRQRFEFRPDTIEPTHCEGPRVLLLSYYGELLLSPGEHWRLRVRLKRPWGLANPGSFNLQAWYAQTGIDGTGSVAKNRAVFLAEKHHWRTSHHVIRQRISRRLNEIGLDEPVRGILQALTVADKSGVDSALWALFQFYGINHLLVISGLHISLVAGAGYLMGNTLGRGVLLLGAARLAGLLPGLMAFSCAFSYAALAGFSLAAVRALCMLGCFIVASLVGRGSLPWQNLLIACVIVQVVNPLAAVGSGFWLSFGAVACLLWLAMWRANARVPLRLLHTHIYMALAMIPLGGWWFGGVSQVAAVANFLLIPLVGLFVVPLALLAALAYLTGIPLDDYLWSLAGWPLAKLLPLAQSLAASQGDLLYHHLTPSLAELILAMIALALLIVPLPGRLKLLVPLLAMPVFLPQTPDTGVLGSHTKLTVLDVGQGTAIVIQSGGRTLVYDTGGGDPRGSNMANRVILPYLRAQGIRSLDTLVVSHTDNDHSAGMQTLVRAMPITQLITGGESPVRPGAQACRAGQAWQWAPGVRFQFLSPEPSSRGTTELSSNNSSCVLQVHVNGIRLLLAGDIDAQRERELVAYWRGDVRSDWLLAGHHGSLTSSSYAWLKTVQPRQLVFSHGYLNQFGHPHKTILQRSLELGSETFSTAGDGALEIHIGPKGALSVHKYRTLYRRYWL